VTGDERLANISTRTTLGTSENVSIGGFIIQGGAPETVLIRGIGPSLAAYGIGGALADPTLELHDSSGNLIATNDNWQDTQKDLIAGTGLSPNDSREAAIWASLMPGSYTAVVTGRNGTTGVALTEIYDLGHADARLANISTRGFVGASDNVMIGGVIITGSDPASILIRALGPSLAQFGIENPLGNPFLELFDSNGTQIATNDDWKATQESEIETSALAPSSELEAAILRLLFPGSYTSVVRSSNGETGIALIEIYNL
jgi:hypothetical protein